MATSAEQSYSMEVHSQERFGFDCEFIERPPESLQSDCPVCMLVLRDPHQVTCCGYAFCQACIERVQLQQSPCPTCKESDFCVFPDKRLQRSLAIYRIHCTYEKEGCQWTGSLREFDEHLNEKPAVNEQLSGCEFTEVECIHCHSFFQRRYINEHQVSECIKRPFSCEYCDYETDFEDVTCKHWPVCAFYPVSCPNECGACPERPNLKHHVSKDCPLMVVNCDFHYTVKNRVFLQHPLLCCCYCGCYYNTQEVLEGAALTCIGVLEVIIGESSHSCTLWVLLLHSKGILNTHACNALNKAADHSNI